jgi:hypothetical protein
MASVNVNSGPPLRAWISRPSRVNVTDTALPGQTRSPKSPYREPQDPGVPEYGDIEVGSLLCLIVEPEEWGDLLHHELLIHRLPVRALIEKVLRADGFSQTLARLIRALVERLLSETPG